MISKKNKIYILYDYRGFFFTSFAPSAVPLRSMDKSLLRDLFTQKGFDVEVMSFYELDVHQDFTGVYIVYSSSEDNDLYYKSYIEDIMLFLEQQGAILLPSYKFLKAHHNKNFMELIRASLQDEIFKTIVTKYFGTYEEVLLCHTMINYPVVIKPAANAGSRGIILARSKDGLLKATKRVSDTFRKDLAGIMYYYNCVDVLLYLIETVVRKILNRQVRTYSRYRKKFIVQSFVPHLDGDYKVLVFGKKYYVLYRFNRKKDFRASGSGNFLFPTKDDSYDGLLDFAYRLYCELNVPFLSVDVGYDGQRYHLLEFQCLHFGPKTLQDSNVYYTRNSEGKFTVNEGKSILEDEYVESIHQYIEKSNGDIV